MQEGLLHLAYCEQMGHSCLGASQLGPQPGAVLLPGHILQPSEGSGAQAL